MEAVYNVVGSIHSGNRKLVFYSLDSFKDGLLHLGCDISKANLITANILTGYDSCNWFRNGVKFFAYRYL